MDSQPLKELRVELTTRCSVRCGYCYVPHLRAGADSNIDRRVFFRRLEEALPLGLETVSFTGGEPLLDLDLLTDLMKIAQGWGMTVGLLTSGYGLTPRIADTLASVGLDWVRLSVDSHPLDASTQLRLERPFSHVPETISLLKARDIPVVIRATATQQNVDGITDLAQFVVHQGISRVEVQPYMPSNAGHIDSRYWMPPKIHFEALCKLCRIRERVDNLTDIVLYSGWFEFLSPEYSGEPVYNSRCGRSFLFVDSNGSIKTCAMSCRCLLGNQDLEGALVDIWREDPYLKALREMEPSGICGDCDWFSVCSKTRCPAVNTVFGLSVNAPTPICPRVALAGTSKWLISKEEEVREHEESASFGVVDGCFVSCLPHSDRRLRT